MTADAYRTVDGPGAAAFTMRGSTFRSHVASAETVEEAEAVVDDVAAEFSDATHVVIAYRIRVDPLREYASDAGEPSGSAGKPALNVLQGRDLENVVAVVVRHYGGTELGIGGLVRAYGRAVGDAVDDAGIVERQPRERFEVIVAYDDSGTVRGLLESAGVTFDADYDERVVFSVAVPVSEAGDLRDRIQSATSGRATLDS